MQYQTLKRLECLSAMSILLFMINSLWTLAYLQSTLQILLSQFIARTFLQYSSILFTRKQVKKYEFQDIDEILKFILLRFPSSKV